MKRHILIIILLSALVFAQQTSDYGSLQTAEERNQYLQQNVATGLTADAVTVSGNKVTLTKNPGKALELQAGYSGEIVMNGKSADIMDKSGQTYSFKSATKVVVENGVVRSIHDADLGNSAIPVGGTTLTGSGVTYDFGTKQGTIQQNGNNRAYLTLDGLIYEPGHGKSMTIDGSVSPPRIQGKFFMITDTQKGEDYRILPMGNDLASISYDKASGAFKLERGTIFENKGDFAVQDTSGKDIYVGRNSGSCSQISGHPLCFEAVYNKEIRDSTGKLKSYVDIYGQGSNTARLAYNDQLYGVLLEGKFTDNTKIELYDLEPKRDTSAFSKKYYLGYIEKGKIEGYNGVPKNIEFSTEGIKGPQKQSLIDSAVEIIGKVCNDPSCPVTFTSEQTAADSTPGFFSKIWSKVTGTAAKPFVVDSASNQNFINDVHNRYGLGAGDTVELDPKRIQAAHGNTALVPGRIRRENGDIVQISVMQITGNNKPNYELMD
jgi:hypothetical protein